MTENQNPTRRDFFKIAGSLIASSFSEKLNAESKGGNPFFSKSRETEMKRAQAIEYSRKPKELETILANMIGQSVAVLAFDPSALEESHLENVSSKNPLYTPLHNIFGNVERVLKEIMSLANDAFEIKRGQRGQSVYMFGKPKAIIMIPYPEKKRVDHNDNIAVASSYVPSETVISVDPDRYNPEQKQNTRYVKSSQIKDWGFKDDLNKPVYNALRDYILIGQSTMGAPAKHTAEEKLRQQTIADCFGVLKLAREYGTTYPARVYSATRITRALYFQVMSKPSDYPKGIHAAIEECSAKAINITIKYAEDLLKNPERLREMSDINLLDNAKFIEKNNHMDGAAIQALEDKFTKVRNHIKSPNLETIEAALSDKALLDTANELDKMIIDAHLFLFSKMRMEQLGASRRG